MRNFILVLIAVALACAPVAVLAEDDVHGYYDPAFRRAFKVTKDAVEVQNNRTLRVPSVVNESNVIPTMFVALPESPATLTGYEDFFLGEDGGLPTSVLWDMADSEIPLSYVYIKDNALYSNYSEATEAGTAVSWDLSFKNLPQGDFDIITEFSFANHDATGYTSGTNYRYHTLGVSEATEYWFLFMVRCAVDQTGTAHYELFSYSDSESVSLDQASGKLRITRSGSTVKAYYWHTGNAQWEWNGNAAGWTFTDGTANNPDFVWTDFVHKGIGSVEFSLKSVTFNGAAVTMSPGTKYLPWKEGMVAMDTSTGSFYQWVNGAWVAL